MKDKFIIAKEIRIDYFHRLPKHKSKCKNPHSHYGLVRAIVEGDVIKEKGVSDEGMCVDFSDIREILEKEIYDRFDHGSIIYIDDEYKQFFQKMKDDGLRVEFVDFIPTAENLAKYFFELLKNKIQTKYNNKLRLKAIEFYETPTSYACYIEEEERDNANVERSN